MATRYAVDGGAARVTAAMDGYAVLYHRPSRGTHVLASPMPELIGSLAAAPATLPELAARLATTHDLAAEDEVTATLAARLDELVAIGLVRIA